MNNFKVFGQAGSWYIYCDTTKDYLLTDGSVGKCKHNHSLSKYYFDTRKQAREALAKHKNPPKLKLSDLKEGDRFKYEKNPHHVFTMINSYGIAKYKYAYIGDDLWLYGTDNDNEVLLYKEQA